MTGATGPDDRVAYLKELAVDSLTRFGGGFADLERLVGEMKSIVRSLDEVADASWTKALLKQWGQLEIVYALVLDEGRSSLSEAEEADVREIVAKFLTEFR
jgi:hypothetical protein